MSENIVNVTDASFEEDVLKAEGAVLVDYWAEWCGPCKMIAPVLEEIAKEYAGKLKVCKLNIDENNETPHKYGIRGIPTLMLFKGGNAEARRWGRCPNRSWPPFSMPTSEPGPTEKRRPSNGGVFPQLLLDRPWVTFYSGSTYQPGAPLPGTIVRVSQARP